MGDFWKDGLRQIIVALTCIVLLFTIIGIPVALLLMQLERVIELQKEGLE